MPVLDQVLLDGILARAGAPDFPRFEAQLRSSGNCEPLCPECFDYEAAFMWNHAIGELWRRTTIYLPRALARLVGMTQKELRQSVRPSYMKVAEYQRRGLVHLHVLVRLDRAMPKYRA